MPITMPMPMSQPKPESDEFGTSDLGQAAFLLVRELPLLRVDHGGERVVFVFPGSAEQTAHLFYRPGQNLVDARKFHLSLRELRGLTRQERWR